METDQPGKSSIIPIAKKRLDRIELRLKDLELEIMGLKQFLDGLSEEKAPERREPAPEKIPEKPPEKPKLLKKKKEPKPAEPIAPPEPQKPLRLEKDSPETETISFETQVQQPKPSKPPVEAEIQLDGVDLRFLKLIASQEEGEHQLPSIAQQLNLPQERLQDVISRLVDKGLLYSPNPIDPNAEFYIDQKGLEALAKKGLL